MSPLLGAESQEWIIRNRQGEEIARHHRIDLEDGKKKIWFSRDGVNGLDGYPSSQLPLYGIDQVVPGGALIVTEGEKAADALNRAGWAAVATVCGASSTPDEDVLADLKIAENVILWADNDAVGADHMKRIHETLMGIGVRAKIVTWGQQRGDDAYDAINRGEDIDAILATATDPIEQVDAPAVFDPDATARDAGEMPPSEFIMGLRAKDFVAAEIAEPRWLVDNIWPEQAIGFVSGQPKVFKSMLAMDLAFAVASGGLFLGTYQAKAAQRTLIIQNESSRTAFRDRLREVATRFGGVPDELVVISNYPILLDDKTWLERMNRDLERIRPALMILDPLASMAASDENSATEIGAVVRTLREWRDKFEMAICIVHHNVKDGAGRRAGQKLRGSGALYGAAEVVVSMERPDDDAPRVAVRMEMKESESPKPFFAEFIPQGHELRIQTESHLIATDEAILAFLKLRGEASVADIASNCNIKVAIAREVVKTLGNRGIRLKPGSGTSNKPAIYYLERSIPIRLGITEE